MDEFSFEKIDYSIRPAKCVERRLIGQTLSFLASAFPIKEYRYVGFGSLWFVDFVLFHRWLQMETMFSIEQAADSDQMPKRFNFNKPLRCIKVLAGTARKCLPRALKGKQKSVVWLDYDGTLEDALSGDLAVALPVMREGNVILISTNAHTAQLKNKRINDESISEVDYLESIAPDLVPANASERVTKKAFPDLAAEILTNALRARTLELGNGLEYVPIWGFAYQDGAPMVTVGGIFLSEAIRAKFETIRIYDRFDFLSQSGKPVHISLPIITLREKLYLDSLMPGNPPPLLSKLKFEMQQESLDAFVRFYNYIPTFGELAW